MTDKGKKWQEEERRAWALERAQERHRFTVPMPTDDVVLDTARKFEAYVKGEAAAEPKPQLDPDKPNHFFHDSEGCPYTCHKPHNHPAPLS